MSATAELRSSGLEGVVAGKTEICSVEQGKLIYRGYEIHDLSKHATFEEVAFLLLVGHKPSKAELTAFKAELVKDRTSKEPVGPQSITAVVDFCRDNGLLVGRAGGGRRYGNTITMSPPLVITRAECDRIVETLDRALSTVDFA